MLYYTLFASLYIYIYIKNIISDFGEPQVEPHAPRWHPHQDHHGCCRGIFAAPLPSKVAASGPSDVWQLSVGTAYGHGDLRLEGADGGLDGLVGVPRVDGSFFCWLGGVCVCVFFFLKS